MLAARFLSRCRRGHMLGPLALELKVHSGVPMRTTSNATDSSATAFVASRNRKSGIASDSRAQSASDREKLTRPRETSVASFHVLTHDTTIASAT